MQKGINVKSVKNYYDMVDKVDGVILSDFHSTGWWPQLSKPYLETGMPTLINRPFALSIKEAKEMIERSKKYNAPILVPSSDEMMLETMKAHYKLQKKLDEGAKILGAMGAEPCGDYPTHGIHSIYNLYTILEPNVIAAALHADKWWKWGAQGALMDWRVKGKNDNPDYYVNIRMSRALKNTNGMVMILTDQGRIIVDNDHVGDMFTRYRNMFLPTCIEFQRMVETHKQPQSYEHILGETRTFLTGFYSHLEKNGCMVGCNDVPENWRTPEVMPDRIPNDIFK